MAFEPISAWASEFSVESILGGDPSIFLPLMYLAASIAIYSILIWHFYGFIARKDCFKISTGNYPRLIGFVKYFLVYPFVTVLFFTGFSLILMFLINDGELVAVLSISFAVIVAIRAVAYYSEDLAKDVAKMLPFVLLAIVMVDPSHFIFRDMATKIQSLPGFFNIAIKFIFFIIIVEWILRMLLVIRYSLFPKKDSEEEADTGTLPRRDIVAKT